MWLCPQIQGETPQPTPPPAATLNNSEPKPERSREPQAAEPEPKNAWKAFASYFGLGALTQPLGAELSVSGWGL